MKAAEGSTHFGKSVVLRGELSGSEDLHLDGRLEGTVRLTAGRLTAGPNAQLLAEIDAPEMIVFGRVVGTLRIAGRLELRQTASVDGQIFAGRLSIEDGALVTGRIELTAPLSGAGAPAARS